VFPVQIFLELLSFFEEMTRYFYKSTKALTFNKLYACHFSNEFQFSLHILKNFLIVNSKAIRKVPTNYFDAEKGRNVEANTRKLQLL